MKFQILLIGLLFSLGGFTTQKTHAQGVTETIVRTGDAAPDGNGTFAEFNFAPIMNASGNSIFFASLDGTIGGSTDSRGIFRESGGELIQVARGGQASPDGNGLFSSFSQIGFNDFGDTAFSAFLSETSGSGGSDNYGLFLSSGGVRSQIARQGQATPEGDATYLFFRGTEINNTGTIAFGASLLDSSPASDDEGIFRFNGGSLTQVVRNGQVATDGNGTFGNLSSSPALNDSGDIVFYGELNGTNGGTTDDRGIFLENNGVMTQIVREGQAVPDGNGSYSSLSDDFDLNEAGSVAFTSNQGVFVGNGVDTTQIVRSGQSAPDENGSFHHFERPQLNASGKAVFSASLLSTSGGFTDDSGIFTGNGGAISQIVREGDAAPDGNGEFLFFGTNYNLNDSGLVAFVGVLNETINGTNDDLGLYLSDGIDLIQVARKGDALHGSTISQLFNNLPSELNNFGQMTYRAITADGNQSQQWFTPDLYWRNSSSGDWSVPDNWTLGLNPAAVHDVYAQSDSDVSISGPASGTIRNLHVGSVAGADRQGQVSLNLNNSNLNARQNAIVNSTGTIAVTGDSWFTVGNHTATGTGSKIVVGDSEGHGNLSVLGGGTINNEGTAAIGSDPGFTGHAVVSGVGSTWANESSVDIGLNGTGTLTVADGGLFTSANARVGHNSDGEGTVNITGANSRWQGLSLDLGSSGSADLIVDNGGVLASSSLNLGRFGEATATVSGGESRIEEAGAGSGMQIGWGSGGIGALVIEDGAVVDGHGGQIATAVASEGSVHVTGAGSTWQSSDIITLGSRGEGTLLIDNGGRVFNESSTMASISSGVADATVSGNGSSWIHERGLTVGGSGTATLSINNNALVSVDSLGIGFSTSIGENSSVSLDNGQFEFGKTDFLGSYSRIGGSSGSLAGDVVVIGDRTIDSLDDFSKSGLNTQRVRHGNANVITGSGISQFGLTNFANGELRTEAGETAQFGGLGSSNHRDGLVTNQGGSVVFDNDFRNRDGGELNGYGSFSFGGGLINEGNLNFGGGDTTVNGSLVNENEFNSQKSRIVTSGNSTTTFTGSVVHNGNRIETEAGSSTVFEGNYSGAGNFTGTGDVFFGNQVSLGNSPAEVDFAGDVVLGSTSETLIELGGLALGEFDRFNITGDFHLDGVLSVELIDGFAPQLNDIFEIADVDGLMFGQFAGLDEGDLVGVYGGFDFTISYLAGDGNDVALFASSSAVPEPGAMGLLMLVAAGLVLRRRRND